MNKTKLAIIVLILSLLSISVIALPPPSVNVEQALFEQALAEDLLLNKELFVSHIIKEEGFQLDLIEIGKGLQAFHRLEMLHQDLKPENIIIDQFGTVKLIDFGSTKVAGIAEITTPLEQTNLLGTKNYTAPEYAKDQPGTNRSDIYSLAVISYEMLSGKLPYGEMPSNWKMIDFKNTLTYMPLIDYNASVPKWISAALRKAVHPDPNKRYEELSEFLYDLRHPNPTLSVEDYRPLIERNPVKFWKGLCLILTVVIIYLSYLLLI